MSDDRESLRRTFGEVAELYDQARPGYPAALLDDLISLAGLAPGARVLEIGCGTGQLTVPLVCRGFALTAVELSPDLAAVARRNLSAVAPATAPVVVEAAFEEWSPPEELFDLAVSATAFHWIDPDVRVPRSVAALRPGGSLAVIDTVHVAGPDPFFDDVQECYQRWDPATDESSVLPTILQNPSRWQELDASQLLGPVVLRRYAWSATYTADAYIDLLLTYSGHRALPAARRAGLLSCIRDLIGQRGGRVTKSHVTELRSAQRVG